MKIDYTHRYPAKPAEVVALLSDPTFIAELAEQAGGLEHSAQAVPGGMRMHLALPLPDAAAMIVGPTARATVTFTFSDPDAAGAIDGTVLIDVAGAPVDAHAAARISPDGDAASTARYTGELSVKVPLVGKKLEQKLEPVVGEVFGGLERTVQHRLKG